MAALTSSQSGNFNSSSTWGGTTPADGDTFTISAGHEVVVNSDIRTTNGYGDITVRGHLKFETNGKMRLNGRITVKGYNSAAWNISGGAWFTEDDSATAGLFSSSGNNMILEVRGNNSDQHGIWVENERFASMKLYADEYLTTTTSSADVDYGDDYISVTSASGFAAEDWIAIFKENEDNRVLGDEGFWVHDVDTTNNRLYIRQFVSPTSVIEDVNGTSVKVTDASVFRENYKVIAGTGSNRKIATINSINYARNELTMSASFVSANEGMTLYQTGAEKNHASGKKVQKVSTTLSTAIETADNTDQITVGSADDISVGDFIWIDVNNDSDYGWDYPSKYEVTAKSGTTLTLDDQVRHKIKKGAVIKVLNRHFTIKGVDTSTDTRPFLYVEYWTSWSDAHTRHIGLRNIRFTQWGFNTNSTYYRGVMIAGYNSEKRDNSSDNRYQYQSHVQGCVIDSCNTSNQSYTGITTRHPHGHTFRNNTGVTGAHPLWHWSSQYHLKCYNNYATNGASGYYFDGVYEAHTEISYNYSTRQDDYGMALSHLREPVAVRHNILLNNEQRPLYFFYQTQGILLERMYMDGYRQLPYIGNGGGDARFLDSYFGNRWMKSTYTHDGGLVDSNQYLGYGGQDGRSNYERQSGESGRAISFEHDFKYDQKLTYQGNAGFLENSALGRLKRCFNFNGNGYAPYIEQIYVPSNTVVRISCKIKGQEGGSYTYPVLFAKKLSGYVWSQGRVDKVYSTTKQTSTNKDFSGFLEFNQYTVAMKTGYEEKQLTVQAQNKGYMLVVGIYHASTNMREEYFDMSDFNIFLSKASPLKVGTKLGKEVSQRDSFSRAKKRIGGTRL